MVTRSLTRQIHISSFGFSGAGFLASYHLGALASLQAQGWWQPLPKLTGVSAGALVAAATAAGVDAEQGMETVLEIASHATRAGRLTTLQPGFSLVDVMETAVRARLRQAIQDDEESFLRRINGHLRIGLTDRRVWRGRPTPQAAVYVDGYRDLDDVVAACVLSSYVPGVTGPTWGSRDRRHGAILRSAQRLQDMVAAGCVKEASTGKALTAVSSVESRELYWDGGLVNAFPVWDADTLIITPMAADFDPHQSINPSIAYGDNAKAIRTWKLPHAHLHMTTANLRTFQSLIWNPDPDNLQSFYVQGYDHASAFLDRHGLQTQNVVRVT